jgi:tetratricopeptide (TPR) repeat protein
MDPTEPRRGTSPAAFRAGRRRLLGALLLAPCPALRAAGPAPLFDGLAGHRHRIESALPRVQRYFDQGMLLVYGFNPAEAVRSFEAAAALDPRCASAWWGLAWALGPNINTDMQAQDVPRLQHALQKARRHAGRASPVRRDLIAALSLRHPGGAPIDEEAYARRLQILARRHPHDADVAMLAAESLLNLHPYDWWDAHGKALPWTPAIEALLQRALKLQPAHPGAHHYWIHLQESSAAPDRAVASADALRSAFPGSGHLLHMPSHIDMRVGRYAAAMQANQRSIEADRRYLEQVDAQGAYRVGYVAHNHHFLWAAASMAGRRDVALDAAQAAWPSACGPAGRDPGLAITAHYAALPALARVRFGLWDELLRHTPPPDLPGPYALALWHYARGTAHARLGDAAAAGGELQRLQALAVSPAVLPARVKNINPAPQLLRIATLTLQADLATAAGQATRAVLLLREATAIEDALQYDEPHLWLAPTRHALGAALLATGQAAQAEAVFHQDLAHYPDNGWSLTGLAQALQALGQDGAARDARARAAKAFAGAVAPPTTPRY